MERDTTRVSSQLVALLDERDNFRVELSLALDEPEPDPVLTGDLRYQLAQVEHQIGAHWNA